MMDEQLFEEAEKILSKGNGQTLTFPGYIKAVEWLHKYLSDGEASLSEAYQIISNGNWGDAPEEDLINVTVWLGEYTAYQEMMDELLDESDPEEPNETPESNVVHLEAADLVVEPPTMPDWTVD
jgi:hypothetical protein